MTNAWSSGAAPPVPPPGGNTTLLEGSTFCRSSDSGDIYAGYPQGLFVSDTRVVSAWQLTLDGQAVEPLSTIEQEPYAATFVGRTAPRPGLADSTLLVLRRRSVVDDGMQEDIVLRNLAGEAAGLMVTVTMAADFADLFEVKESRIQPRPGPHVDVGVDTLIYTQTVAEQTHTITLSATGKPQISPGQLSFRVVVPPHGEWLGSLTLQAKIGSNAQSGPPQPVDHTPAGRLRRWRLETPRILNGTPELTATLRMSATDLGALQIHDPRHPERRVVAAGVPWFMALFGRDSLLTSWMALPLDQRLALGTLQTLADHQGTKVDPLTEEEPGRILHEVRLGTQASLALGGGNIYYGTADATPLFVMLLGELQRWGLPDAQLASVLPNADRALDWIRDYGDRDGDGFVEYQRATDRGLVNQGWKDSFDGITDSSGRIAVGPTAVAEVQAYVYAAYLARADIAANAGDKQTAAGFRSKAADLKVAFNEQFWLPDKGWYAIALDGRKQPVDSLASNMGHCLWCGIVDDDKAPLVAKQLVDAPLWNGFGIRTLATTMGAHNPMSYHNGSVWPHDSAIAAAGLMRYGFVEQAQKVALGILDAARQFGNRLPELFCGFDRADFPAPIPYPTSCSPQAWAAAAPILLVRTLLRLQPDLPANKIQLGPALPKQMLPLRIDNLPLGEHRLGLDVRADSWDLHGLPPHLSLTNPEPL
jgi:glycogen debranching enzyme